MLLLLENRDYHLLELGGGIGGLFFCILFTSGNFPSNGLMIYPISCR